MNTSPTLMHGSPQSDFGYFHLTDEGWVRKDAQPFPAGRLETWQYEEERPANDAKDQIRLTRIWHDPSASQSQLESLHAYFGEAICPDTDRHITLNCLT